MSFFIHPHGICETDKVGDGTKIWAFAHVLSGAVIGKDCNICNNVFIENDVVLGDRVTVKNGVQLWNGLRISDDVFIGPNATFTNDPFPRSKFHVDPVQTHIGRAASIGAASVIFPGLTIGSEAMVGAGAVVTHNVPARAIVMGNPAVITGYIDTPHFDQKKEFTLSDTNVGLEKIGVGNARLFHMSVHVDLRGSLTVGSFDKEIPFIPSRFFITYDVPGRQARGEHAHKKCIQFLICTHGSVSVVLDDGQNRSEVNLNKPSLGLYIPPMVWATQYRHSENATLLVFASHPYESEDYIRNYDEFLATIRK